MISRSFYLVGDAHLYYGAASIQSEYIFDRPPPETMVSHSSTSAAEAAAMQQYYHPLCAVPPAAHGSSGSSASSGVAMATAGGAGGAWLAYESAEFTPMEDILLDLTAWVIAICMCYDPSRGKVGDDDEEEEPKRSRNETTDRNKRLCRQHERLGAAQERTDENDCSNDQNEEQQHPSGDNERN
jgi:hypothetical protein